jgi:hypothetical protein
MKRLHPLANAIVSGVFDPQNVRTWPIVLLKLDEGRRDGRRLEKKLLGRNITMVAELLGANSPLAKPELRKGIGRSLLERVEEKLKPYDLLGELAWNVPPPDSRRALQDEIERRIEELNRLANGQ